MKAGGSEGVFAKEREADFAQRTFLVIDDFDSMRTMLRDILRAAGVDAKAIDTANSGKLAIEMLEQRKYDGVLCDYNLGAGMNGQQILEEAKIRRLVGPACAWLMVTAEKTSEAVTGAAEYQPDGYLIKPITESALRTRLARVWAKKEALGDIDKAMAADDYPKAIRLCEERLQSDKANAADLLRLKCQLLLKCGELDRAQQTCEAVLAERDVPWAKAGLAKIRYQKGDYESTLRLLREVLDENPWYLEAHDWLAKVLQASGELEQAEQAIERAAKLSPNSVVRQKNLGEVALKRGNLDKAEGAFRKSVALGEFSVLKTPDAYLGLAKTHSAKNNPNEAMAALGKLSKEFDSDEVRVKVKTAEGLIHHQNGDPARALQAVRELGEMLKDASAVAGSPALLEAAQLMLAMGEKGKAVALLQYQVMNNPEDPLLLEQVRRVFEQAKMGEEGSVLVETSRKEAIEKMNHGVLLMREGELKKAVDWMREAKQAMPANVRALFNFAHVAISFMQGSGPDDPLIQEAQACLQEAKRRAPGDLRYAALMAKLEQLNGGS